MKGRVQVTVSFNNCKQNITSLSLLAGTTVSLCAYPFPCHTSTTMVALRSLVCFGTLIAYFANTIDTDQIAPL